MKTKRCFCCKKIKPLFLYNINRMKYKIYSDFNRLIICKICEFKRVTSGSYVKYNFKNNKFEILPKLGYWKAFYQIILGIKR